MSQGLESHPRPLKLQEAPNSRAPLLTCADVGLVFDNGSDPVVALRDVSLSVAQGEFVCLVGPSGCGKTSLLKAVAGLTQPASGRIEFHGRRSAQPLTPLVFQDHGLFPWRSVADNVAFGLAMAGVPARPRRLRALEMIDRVGLTGFADCLPHQLSVGMRQRVAIGRALLCDADLLLMDEPFGSLDAQTKIVLQDELLGWWKDRQQAVLYVTHDLEEAVALGDRVLVLSARPGRVLAEIEVTLPRPRSIESRLTVEFQEIKAAIWNQLRDQIGGHL